MRVYHSPYKPYFTLVYVCVCVYIIVLQALLSPGLRLCLRVYQSRYKLYCPLAYICVCVCIPESLQALLSPGLRPCMYVYHNPFKLYFPLAYVYVFVCTIVLTSSTFPWPMSVCACIP